MNEDNKAGANTSIPVEDAAAALRFCRNLDSLLHGDIREETGQVISDSVPEVSLVVPAFNEEENLPELHSRATAVLSEAGLDYEIIIVDDGSSDSTPDLLRDLAASDTRVIVVELSRNFGHQVAISAGLDFSRGKAVIMMDADLQDPPEIMTDLIAQWRAGNDVVYAVRQNRKEHWLKRLAYRWFYRILSRIANVRIPLDAGDFCLMDRRVVDILDSMPERSRFVRGMRSWVGLKQVGLRYDRQSRHAGRSKYSFWGLLYLALDGIVSLSYMPLRMVTMLGFTVSVFSLLLAVFYVVKRLLVGLTPPGFATLITAILFFAGLQLITIGLVGEYVGRIFDEVKRRPLYVVRRVTRCDVVDGQCHP